MKQKKQLFVSLIVVLMVILMAGCSDQAANQLQVELDEANKKIEELTAQIEDSQSSDQLAIGSEEELEQIFTALFILELRTEGYQNLLADLSSLLNQKEPAATEQAQQLLTHAFDPLTIQEGDQVGNYKVTKVAIAENDDGRYDETVEFEGDFILSGELILSELTDGFTLIVDASGFEKIPYALHQYGQERVLFFAIPEEAELLESIAAQGVDFPAGDEATLPITARFSKYTYHFLPESEGSSFLTFQELLSIDE